MIKSMELRPVTFASVVALVAQPAVEQEVTSTSWLEALAPKGAPSATIDRLAETIEQVLNAPGAEEHLAALNLCGDFEASTMHG